MSDMEGAELLLQKSLFSLLSGQYVYIVSLFSYGLSSVFHVNPKEYAR